MKCLPQSKLPSAQGTILHDWHAEVLAIRALNHFILRECKEILAAEMDEGGDQHHCYDSPYIRRRTNYINNNGDSNTDGSHQQQQQPFVWRKEVTLHMYCSEAPCGDASMELTMSAQEDASPWESPLPPHLLMKTTTAFHQNGESSSITNDTPSSPEHDVAVASSSIFPAEEKQPPSAPDLFLLGRACFSHLGVVRRKPARPDAPPTLSKSCSDKLAMHQCTSLLSGLVSLLVSPSGVYLRSLVLPETQYSATACVRCFSPEGRMAPLVSSSSSSNSKSDGFTIITDVAREAKEEEEGEGRSGYAFRPFEVRTTSLEFSFSRRGGSTTANPSLEDRGDIKYVASALSTAWSANGLAENIIGGVLQGRKQTDPRGGSQVSRAKMWELARAVVEMAQAGTDAAGVAIPSSGTTYRQWKEGPALHSRRRVKERVIRDALKGWVKNIGDDKFHLHT